MVRLTTFGMCGETVSGNGEAVQSDLAGRQAQPPLAVTGKLRLTLSERTISLRPREPKVFLAVVDLLVRTTAWRDREQFFWAWRYSRRRSG
jgi:hypothetical protein